MIDIPPIIYAHVVPFLMVLFRITGIFIYGPIFGSRLVPMRVKALMAFVLALAVYPAVMGQLHWATSWGNADITAAALPTMIAVVLSELLIGVIIGFGAALPLHAMQVGGMMMGQQLGLGLANVINPEFNEQSSVMSQIMFFGALVIFLLLNGHHGMLIAVISSFGSVPVGGFTANLDVINLLIGLMSSMFDLGFRVSAPLLCIIFLETIAMGFIAKTVPQFNILSLGFPLRIVLGLILMVVIMGPILTLYGEEALLVMNRIMDFFQFWES